MDSLGLILIWGGGLVAVVGTIWLIVAAFQESVLWGLGCLLFTPVGLVFAICYWDEAQAPFLVSVAGSAGLVVGVMLGGGGA